MRTSCSRLSSKFGTTMVRSSRWKQRLVAATVVICLLIVYEFRLERGLVSIGSSSQTLVSKQQTGKSSLNHNSTHSPLEMTTQEKIHHGLSPFDPSLLSPEERSLLHFEPHALNTTLHPHRGAKFSNGSFGYVADLHFHWKNPPLNAFSLETREERRLVCEAPGHGPEGRQGWRAMNSHLTIAQQTLSVSNRPSRILCAIYTHSLRIPQTNAIRQTWGRKCDGLFFASTVTDDDDDDDDDDNHELSPDHKTNATSIIRGSGHVHLPHESQWEGQYNGIWQRVRAMFSYIYQHYLNDYDYVHICGDDTFVIMENLRAYMSSDTVANMTLQGKPFFGGFWTHWQDSKTPKKKDFYYLGGGSGYTLNAKAIQLFVETVSPVCQKSSRDASEEDVFVSWCFKFVSNLTGFDTRDEYQAHRYHLLSLEQAATLAPGNPTKSPDTLIVERSLNFMNEIFGFPLVWNLDYLSESSVAFHNYKTTAAMKRMERLLYGTGSDLCLGVA